MKFPSLPALIVGCSLLVAVLSSASAAETEIKHGWSTLRFSQPAQQSDPVELKFRLHSVENPQPFKIAGETFDLFVPESYDGEKAHGLFIWISPGNRHGIPKAWEALFAKHRLIVVSARNSGNKRAIFDRMRMAVDANHNLRQRFRIDGRRVYVSGFSGGGRVASMLGVAYADMFSGAIPCMGVNFYRPVTDAKQRRYGESYIPDDQVLGLAKRFCRFVLVTGSKDFNRDNTLAVFRDGFQAEKFAFAKYLEVPDHAHRPPPAAWMDKALDLISSP